MNAIVIYLSGFPFRHVCKERKKIEIGIKYAEMFGLRPRSMA